jgi:hypothetical protein
MRVRWPSGQEDHVSLLGGPPKDLILSGKSNESSIVLSREDFLPIKSLIAPIPNNGGLRGFLWGIVKGADKDRIFKEGTILVSFTDVKGHPYEVSRLIASGGKLEFPNLNKIFEENRSIHP